MVVDLAVDSQHDVAARAHQRLVAALWVHDAEPLVGKHCCLGEVHARPVWPAVALALRQLDYCFPHLGWLSWFKPQQRQDAAHCCGVVLWCCGVVVAKKESQRFRGLFRKFCCKYVAYHAPASLLRFEVSNNLASHQQPETSNENALFAVLAKRIQLN